MLSSRCFTFYVSFRIKFNKYTWNVFIPCCLWVSCYKEARAIIIYTVWKVWWSRPNLIFLPSKIITWTIAVKVEYTKPDIFQSERVRVVRITPKRFGFNTEESALKYYQKGSGRMYLLMRNDVFAYDRHPIVQALFPISLKIEQIAAIALGIFPKNQVIPSEENRRVISSLRAKRNRYFGAMILLLLLGLSLWTEISSYRRWKAD